MTQTGLYGGNDPSGFAAANKWLGRAADNVLAYLNNDNWSAFDSSIAYETNLWKGTAASNIWSVPLTVWGTSLEQVSTGNYNNHFLKAAQGLAETHPSSDGNIYIRVGWEFNGSWMPWAAQGHEAAFVKAFQNLVDTFRSVSNNFKFVWDVNESDSNYNPANSYPGDKYVDVVGMDTYYNTAWDSKNPHAAFQHNVHEQYGLQWQQDFAAAHGKATSISEWGVMTNDSWPYIQDMTNWMNTHNIVFQNYWDSNADYNGMLSNGQNPDAGAALKQAFATLSGVSAPPSVLPSPAAASSAPPTTPSSDTLVFKVSGDNWQGAPHFIVKVDGQQVGGTLTTSASHANGESEDINLSGTFGAGAHNIAVTFVDDAWGGSDKFDRNLYIHQISLNGQVQSSIASSNTAGNNNNGVESLLTNGTANFQTGGNDTLIFKVSGDSWQGNPHFIAMVDGRQVGGVLSTSASHAGGQTQDVTLSGNFGSGSHKIEVVFIDDAWGGSAESDRNLYIHQVSLNGHIETGDLGANHAGVNGDGIAKLYFTGSADWHF